MAEGKRFEVRIFPILGEPAAAMDPRIKSRGDGALMVSVPNHH